MQAVYLSHSFKLTASAIMAGIEGRRNRSMDQHRWTKEVSDIEFSFTDRGSKGTVIWQKRNELLLKSGAELARDPQLNKDGSLNYSAKVATAFRAEREEKIKDGFTTEDLILKSPNELGIFLRYGGADTWKGLVDKDGKSLSDLSKY